MFFHFFFRKFFLLWISVEVFKEFSDIWIWGLLLAFVFLGLEFVFPFIYVYIFFPFIYSLSHLVSFFMCFRSTGDIDVAFWRKTKTMLAQKQAEEAIVSNISEQADNDHGAGGGKEEDQSSEQQHSVFSVKSFLWHGGSAWDAWFSCASNQVKVPHQNQKPIKIPPNRKLRAIIFSHPLLSRKICRWLKCF